MSEEREEIEKRTEKHKGINSAMNNFLKRTRRLIPGNRAGIHVLAVGNNLITEEKNIDEHLAKYWGNIFKDPQLPSDRLEKLSEWIRELGPQTRLPPDAPPLIAGNMTAALKGCGRSAPGPDGIPYEAYRNYLPAKGILHDVLGHMMENKSVNSIPPDFNYSRMTCLPKKPSGHDAELGDYYSPENTRPLSIVNTDNRLLAAALKFSLHDYLENWISEAQQGFLTGRSML